MLRGRVGCAAGTRAGEEGRSLGTPAESVIDARSFPRSFPRSPSCYCLLTDKRTRVEFRVLLVPHDGRLGLGVMDDARQLHLLILLHFQARPGEDPGQLNLGRRH